MTGDEFRAIAALARNLSDQQVEEQAEAFDWLHWTECATGLDPDEIVRGLKLTQEAARRGEEGASEFLTALFKRDIVRMRHLAFGTAKYSVIRRERKAAAFGSHTVSEWRAVLKAAGGKCAHCGSRDRIAKDHIVPLCAGGSELAVNLQPLCKRCNSVKGGRIKPGTQIGVFDRVDQVLNTV